MHNVGMLFLVGIIILCGFLGGKVINRIKFPAVVGFLLVGVLLGPSLANLLDHDLLKSFNVFNALALSLVAYIIGNEMPLDVLKKMGKGLITIIFSESIAAFLAVFIGVFLLTKKLHLALIFGAMAPASAPAGTAIVLQEFKARGPLTNALYVVVGLDDGLAIIIYAFAIAFAKISLMGGHVSLATMITWPIIEISGSIVLGGAMGYICGFFLQKIRKKEDVLPIALAMIFICTGISKYFHLSLILANLTFGMMVATLFRAENRRIINALTPLVVPIYIIFFVLAGAHLHINHLSALGLLGIMYIVCRIIGLMGGAYVGATMAKSEPVIKKYLGLGILSQAGVAIGLAMLVSQEFSSLGPAGADVSLLVMNTIAATTIVFEIIGPLATKYAITRAGEIGQDKDIREE